MPTDPDLLKQLIETFTTELEEQTQVMIDSLLQLEKSKPGPDFEKYIEILFRASHNIKGASRGIGINNVGEIAHQLEDIFTEVRKKTLSFNTSNIDPVLDAVDKMRLAMIAYVTKKPLPFDLEELKIRLARIAEKKDSAPVKPQNYAPADKDFKIETPAIESTTKNTESIRVSIDSIERISTLMEEFQINKIAIDDHSIDLEKINEKNEHLLNFWDRSFAAFPEDHQAPLAKIYQSGLDEITEINRLLGQLHRHFIVSRNELSVLSNSLHDEISRLRLVPASFLLQTLPRLVRSLAQELHKEVQLHIKDDDVKMDKLILEGLNDPLIHLIRNAIDHGIEAPAIRQKLNKTAYGNINVEVVDEGKEILIIFRDDGAGINVEKIAENALNKNLITEAELAAATNDEILQLIFRSGFSTNDIITNISGRGVGLDVVKSNLMVLKGTVKVETELHRGTTFYLRVPLTLANERGLLINAGNENFVVPTNAIMQVMNIKAEDIVLVEGEEVVLLDQHPVVLRSLAKILNLKEITSNNAAMLPVIIVKKDWHTLGLLVNEIIGEREIIVKPLQNLLQDAPCMAGGTLASTGQVILVLDVGDIIARGLNNNFGELLSLSEIPAAKSKKIPHILVVDDSITTRTLEKNVLENKGYKVTLAVNGKEAWDLIQNKPFSMVITDINMPVMDGFELTERVKQSEKFHTLPVIIVTSLGSDADKRRGVEVGANAFIVKSEFESNILLQTVSQLV